MDIEALRRETELSQRKDRAVLAALFVLGIALGTGLYVLGPDLPSEDRTVLLTLPTTPEAMAGTIAVVERYTAARPVYVRACLAFLYVFLQAFAIPGPLLLSILSGALFGFTEGFLTVCLCATVGACCCYLLSASLGKGLVLRWVPHMLLRFHQSIHEHQHDLLWYLLFLRITPLLPNWFINIASPIVGVPLSTFALATLLGIMPGNVIHVNVGVTIASVKSLQGVQLQHVVILLGLGGLALLPALYKRRYGKKFA